MLVKGTTDDVIQNDRVSAYVCVRNWVRLGSGNGLSPVWQEAITWTKAGLLSSEPLRINFSEIGIEL